ncbi:MAG: RNA-binding protein [Gammaproteobacteria bacterium]|nr:MAG: RNA-binding protein [Gammaproteobacteria bacterium]
MPEDKNIPQKVRVDKWLWAARFFKTRAIAADAVNGGKVHVNDQRVKSSRPVQAGDQLEITRGQIHSVVKIVALNDKRGPAKAAQLLYEETPQSIQERELRTEQRKLLNASMPKSHGKPDKHQRREIRKVSGKH